MKVTQFIDDLLVKFYELPAFYKVTTRDDLIGHLVIGLAPHTSAGVLARLIGFTKANVGYAHPFFHAAKRRNCFYGDTEIEIYDGKKWSKTPIRKFVLENFDLSKPGIDRLGTYYSDPTQSYYTRSIDSNGILHLKRITSVSIHRSPSTLPKVCNNKGKGNYCYPRPFNATLGNELSSQN